MIDVEAVSLRQKNKQEQAVQYMVSSCFKTKENCESHGSVDLNVTFVAFTRVQLLILCFGGPRFGVLSVSLFAHSHWSEH